jgi:DNA-binding GntR family transcriptional regulator
MATSGCGIEWLILKYIYKLKRLHLLTDKSMTIIQPSIPHLFWRVRNALLTDLYTHYSNHTIFQYTKVTK